MGKPVETKRKKKGRPSLLDLQKRSLRLRKQQEQQLQNRNPNRKPSPIPNPYARFPNPSAGRRSIRQNSNPEPQSTSSAEEDDDTEAADSMEDHEDDDDDPKVRRKEKKLKLVLHLPHPNTNSSNITSSTTELNGAIPLKRKDDTVGKTYGKNSAWKATEAPHETSDLGPTTPLPDKKLLNFILDRLQKKDTYGVFSEPVDPDELPDYHDIIKHPMDFGTVRKRISSGTYNYLEQFEGNIFLISSNAMHYNAPDTVYYRQARSIHELAKKCFENLRQETDGSELQPKIARRGRPPGTGKNNIKQRADRSSIERTGSEFTSDALLANAVDDIHSSGLRNDLLRKGSGLDQAGAADLSEAFILGSDRISDRNEDYSDLTWKGLSNYGKKLYVMDESRRNAYEQYQMPYSVLDGERKILLQVGFHENAYARSLARFAANLGPIGWKIAAKVIEKVLPLEVKFGPWWVGGEIDAQQSQPLQFSNHSPHTSLTQSNISTASRYNQSEVQDELSSKNTISTIAHDGVFDSTIVRSSLGSHQNTNLPPYSGMLGKPNASLGNYGLEAIMARAHLWPATITRNEERVVEPASSLTPITNLGIPLSSSGDGPWNVRAVGVDPQRPDLVLQL